LIGDNLVVLNDENLKKLKIWRKNGREIVNIYLFIFCKRMKFRNQARLCLDLYDFEAHIMLSIICLTFQGAGYGNNLTP